MTQKTDEPAETTDTFTRVYLEEIGQGELPFNEIQGPESVSWLPQTIGWKVLLVCLLLYLAWLVLKKLIWYWHNRHRYQAIVILRRLEKSNSIENTLSILALLKKVALVSYSRKQVASLQGEAWFEFLSQTSKSRFDSIAEKLVTLTYHDNASPLSTTDFQCLVQQSRHWIKQHNERYFKATDKELNKQRSDGAGLRKANANL